MKLSSKFRLVDSATDVALAVAFPPYAVIAAAGLYTNVKAARKSARKDGGK